MAKKNYQRLESYFEPKVIPLRERQVVISFRCKNSKGTDVNANIRIEKFWLPALIKEFARIAKADQANANRFVQQIKESAE